MPGTPLHVKVEGIILDSEVNLLATMKKEEIQEGMIEEVGEAKTPLDGIDLGLESYSPYKFQTILDDRLWRVRYDCIFNHKEDVDFFRYFGVDWEDPDLSAVPENLSQIVLADIADLQEEDRLKKEEGKEVAAKKKIQKGGADQKSMLVARLNSGGLLLYSPVRMQPELVKWLADLGEVKWIVAPDQNHVFWVGETVKQYPDATYMTSDAGNMKLSSNSLARFADVMYSDPNSLEHAREILAAEGVQVAPCTSEVLHCPCALVVHGHLLSTALLFGDAENKQLLGITTEQWNAPGYPGAHGRLLYYLVMKHSPNGYLPPWRYVMMDPTHVFAMANVLHPKEDGSSCTELAEQLRHLCKLDFDAALDIDTAHHTPMPADEFRAYVDKTWNWLDGKSLL